MPISLVTTAFGAPAAAALAAAVEAAKAGDAMAPVTVIVPSNPVGVSTRRSLAARPGGRGVAAVQLLTVYRLAELLGAPTLAAQGRRPVSTPVVLGAVRTALAEQPGALAVVAQHPATHEALLGAHRTLSRVDAAGLDQIARGPGHARDVVRLHRRVRALLARAWYDEADLLEAAIDAVAANGPLVRQIGHLVVHLPVELDRRAASLVRRLADTVGATVILGVTGRPDADCGTLGIAADLGIAGADAGNSAVDRPERDLAVISTSDADDEARAAVRQLLVAARSGTPLDRVAVLYGSDAPYRRLVAERLTAAGLTWNGPAAVPFAERMAPRTLLTLLALPAGGWSRHATMAAVASAPLRIDGFPVPSARWERLSREAGIVAGEAQWHQRLAALATSRRADAELLSTAEETSIAPRALWLAREADQIDALDRFVRRLVADLAAGAQLRTWAAMSDWATRFLRRWLGGETVRERWPADEARAAEQVEAALARLGGLDAVAGAPTLELLTQSLSVELDGLPSRHGRAGEGITVGPLGAGLALDADVVIIVGLAEGVVPSRPNEDSLLTDADRARSGGALPVSSDVVARQHRQLLAAAAAARSRLVLCAPRGDLRRTVDRPVSRWLLDIVAEHHGRPITEHELRRGHLAGVEVVPSFAAALRSSPPATVHELRVRHRLAGLDDGDPVLVRARRLLTGRRQPTLTEFDGNLAGLAEPLRHSDVTSATRLEAYARCPLAYLMRYVFRVNEVTSPEEALTISAIDRGRLLHEVLDRFVSSALARPAEARPTPDDPWSQDDQALLMAMADATFAAYEARGLTGVPLLWRREQAALRRELSRFLADDDEQRRAGRFQPVATELVFGPDAQLPSVDVAVPGSRIVRLRGSIDRLDRSESGALLVTDYKSGASRTEGRPESWFDHGRKLQLPAYALAARASGLAGPSEHPPPVSVRYWFLTERGGGAELRYDVDDSVLHRYATVVGAITEGMAGGVFPAFPDPPADRAGYVSCPYCDPDGLGTAERSREWLAKQNDPLVQHLLSGLGGIDA